MSEEDLSEAERIEWLRKRGVIVDMPEDRKVVVDYKESDLIEVLCAKIPADEKLPYEDIVVKFPKNAVGDQMIIGLKHKFSTAKGSLNDDLLKEATEKQFGSQGITVNKNTIEELAAQGSVESFTLVHPNLDNGCLGINAYLDEAGQLKGLPYNRRAAELARLCGFENVPFAGDIYIGRVHYSTTTGLINVNFVKDEVTTNNGWLRNAIKSNYDYGLTANKIGVRPDDTENYQEHSTAAGYRWKETEEELEISFSVECDKKNIAVKITRSAVVVSRKSDSVELFNVKLHDTITPDECTWTYDINAKLLDVTLMKSKNGLWKTVE